MKLMITGILSFAFCLTNGQSLIGTWQMTKETNCLEEQVTDTVKMDDDLLRDFSSKSSYSPKVIIFKADHSGEESIRTANKKGASSTKKFLYKRDGESLYILDKKSQLIVGNLIIETLTSDSLVYHTAGKVCDKAYFVRTKGL